MPKNLRDLIESKREWTAPLSEAAEQRGFRGWRSRGYLPHFDAPGLRQMITYRLADSMPMDRRHEWEHLLKIEDERERRTQIENYLDAGKGNCELKQPEIAAIVQENLLHFDGQRYRLIAWVVMPNHVHVLAEIVDTPMDEILHSWKSFTAKAINNQLGRSGELWQTEYFDRYIRDEEHLRKVVRYIENNPVKARLVRTPHEWQFGSAFLRSAGGSPAGS